jgi:hypothetical protein
MCFLLIACESHPMPKAHMAVADAVVQRGSGSSANVDSKSLLQVANSKLLGAREAMAKGEYKLAGQLADQAQVDAQLAGLQTRSEQSRKDAQDLVEAARDLSEEIHRKAAH